MNYLLKYVIILFSLTVFFSACSNPPNNRFEIQGTVINNPNNNDSVKLYYEYYWFDKQQRYIDSVTAINNHFTISGIIDEPQWISISDTLSNLWPLPRMSKNTNTVYFIEPKTMQGEIDLSNWDNCKLTGSKSNEEYILLENLLKPMYTSKMQVWESDAEEDVKIHIIDSLRRQENKTTVQFIKSYPQSYVSLSSIIWSYPYYTPTEQVVLDSVFRQMPAEIRNMPKAKYLLSRIGLHPISQGSYMPHLVMEDVNENEISFKEIWTQSRYTLIQFCVSWHDVCHIDASNLREIYDNYHSKGLEIISVDIDDDAEKWKEAAAKDSSVVWTWVQEDRRSKAGKTRSHFLGITNFPAKILIDQNGKVIATWMSRKERYSQEETVEEVLERLL